MDVEEIKMSMKCNYPCKKEKSSLKVVRQWRCLIFLSVLCIFIFNLNITFSSNTIQVLLFPNFSIQFTYNQYSNQVVARGKSFKRDNSDSNKPHKSTPVVPKKSKPLNKVTEGENLLIKAMRDGNNTKARSLIMDFGADVNYRSEKGNSPLHIASYNGDEDMIHFLLNYMALMTTQDKEGNTFLHILVREGYYRIISGLTFLDDRKMRSIVNMKNVKGNTALDMAYASMNENHFDSGIIDDLLSIGGKISATLNSYAHSSNRYKPH